MICPFGGNCIDPGIPSDCEVNSRCVCFLSTEEKAEFDSRRDEYEIVIDDQKVIRFKTRNQALFFLADLPSTVIRLRKI